MEKGCDVVITDRETLLAERCDELTAMVDTLSGQVDGLRAERAALIRRNENADRLAETMTAASMRNRVECEAKEAQARRMRLVLENRHKQEMDRVLQEARQHEMISGFLSFMLGLTVSAGIAVLALTRIWGWW